MPAAAPVPVRQPLPRRRPRARQRTLFCSCGEALPAVAGLCRRCYRAALHSRARFDGQRESVVERDRGRCVACGAERQGRSLHVHHRIPGRHTPDELVSLCAACHARIHHLAALRSWLPEFAVELWIEQHPQVPLQLQFPFTREKDRAA